MRHAYAFNQTVQQLRPVTELKPAFLVRQGFVPSGISPSSHCNLMVVVAWLQMNVHVMAGMVTSGAALAVAAAALFAISYKSITAPKSYRHDDTDINMLRYAAL